MLYVGIDPGQTGAVAVLGQSVENNHNNATMRGPWVEDMPENPQDLWRLLSILGSGPCRCAIEKVGVFPGQGIVSGFNFGVGYGMIQGMLWAAKIPFVFVTPRKWQAVVFDSAIRKRLPKDQSLDLARRMWQSTLK
jgi:hypothetical protein